MVTDSISNYFFTTSENANGNLRKAGIKNNRILFVGNTMIDTLLKNPFRFKKPLFWDELDLKKVKYVVLTLHRPANVDEEGKLKELINQIIMHSQDLPVIFPFHLRTGMQLKSLGITHSHLLII